MRKTKKREPARFTREKLKAFFDTITDCEARNVTLGKDVPHETRIQFTNTFYNMAKRAGYRLATWTVNETTIGVQLTKE